MDLNLSEKISKFRRNEAGLLDGVTYQFNEDGSINWRALINPQYLYINTDNFLRRGEKEPATIDGVSEIEPTVKTGHNKSMKMLLLKCSYV